MNWKSPITRIVLAFLLLGVASAGVVTWREYERGQRIEREIDMLRSEARRIQAENQGLSEKIAYFASPNFQEQEAKQKLGFKRQEEQVILVRPDTFEEVASPKEDASLAAFSIMNDTEPNYKKWWKLFRN